MKANDSSFHWKTMVLLPRALPDDIKHRFTFHKIRPLDQQYQHHLNLGRYTNSQHRMKSTVSEALRVRLSCPYLQQTSKDFKTSALKCLVVKRYIHSAEDAGSMSLEVWIQVLLTLILTKNP